MKGAVYSFGVMETARCSFPFGLREVLCRSNSLSSTDRQRPTSALQLEKRFGSMGRLRLGHLCLGAILTALGFIAAELPSWSEGWRRRTKVPQKG